MVVFLKKDIDIDYKDCINYLDLLSKDFDTLSLRQKKS
jgi:hypothetical protein